MSQISNIHGAAFVQSTETSQAQAARPVAPNFRTPAALLARLSGVGKFTSPFKLSLVGKNSYLAGLSEQFARRPLGNTAEGRLASEMLTLADSLAVGSISANDLAQLEALRAKTEMPDISNDAQDFCNALARSVMLRPLTEAAAGLDSKVMRTQLAESLHGLLDHLFTAKDEGSFFQASSELSGLKETFSMLGILGADQQTMFEHLEGVLSFRESISKGLDTLAGDLAKIAQGQTPDRSIDECLASANELCRKLRFAPDAPAMARMDIGPLDTRAQRIITELGLSITQKATAIASRMADLATAARTAGTDLAALAKEVASVKNDLSTKSSQLSSAHFGVLQGMGDSLEGALLTSRLLNEADALLARGDASPEELHAKVEELTAALEKPGLDSEDKVRLGDGKIKLKTGISQLQELALSVEENFAKGIEKRLASAGDEKSYDPILNDINARKDSLPQAALSEDGRIRASNRLTDLEHQAEVGKLMAHFNDALVVEENFAKGIEKRLASAGDEKSYDPILNDINARKDSLPQAALSEDGRIRASNRLTDLEHQAEVGKLMAHFNDALVDVLEQKEGTPTLAELSAELDNAENKGMATSTARDVLNALSHEHLVKLNAFADRQEKAIEESPKPSEVKTFFDAVAEEARRFLLSDDNATFSKTLGQLIEKHRDTIYAKEAASQLTSDAFKSLDEPNKATLKELCLSADCHPSLIRKLNTLDAQALRNLLLSFQNIQNSKTSGAAPQDDDIRAVDAHLLPYPELDDVASALLRKNDPTGEPDYRFDSTRMLRDLKTYMEKNFSSALLRNVSLPGTDVSDISFLAEVVACAAKARLVDKAQLQQVDFSLIQALWFCSKASEASLGFTEFKSRLPEPYKSMPLLKEYMDAGISGRRALRSLDHSLTLSSQGMGTRRALMSFLSEAQAQNIKWSAGLGIKALYKDLGLKEFEALEGRFKNVLEGDYLAEGKDAVAEVYAGTADRLISKAEAFKEQERSLTESELRGRMAARIGLDVNSTKSLKTGSGMAGCILLLDKVLNTPSITLEEQQYIIRGMTLPSHLKLEKSIDISGFVSDDKGKAFKECIKTIAAESCDRKTFQKAKDDLLALMKDRNLVEKAEAVLYFKDFGDRNTVDAVKDKIWETVSVYGFMLWDDGHPLRTICNQAEQSILTDLRKHGVFAGAGHAQNEQIKKAQANADHVEKEASKRLKSSVNSSFEQARKERITKIVSLAVCEQITLNAELNTLDDLKNAIDTHKTDLENWPFYQATYKRLCAMGLPEGTAKLYLRSFLTTVDRDFFVDLAKSGQKGTNTKDRIYSLVSAQMTELRDHGKTLTLSTSAEGTLSLVAGAAGVADVGVIIKSARENGLTAWKDTDGTYHMTVMDGVKGGVTAEIAAEFKKLIKTVSLEAGVRAEAGVDGNFSHGCDISFPNATQCQMFLFAILSRQTGPELFGLCKEASLVTEGGLGARVSLSGKASVTIGEDEDALLATELGAGAEGSIKWSKTVNSEHTQRSRTVTGSVALKAEASLNLGVLDSNVNSFAEVLKGKLTDKVEGKIDDTLSTGLPESVTDTVKEKVGTLADAASGKALDAFSSAMDEVRKKGEDGVLTAEKSSVFSYEETRTITERNSFTNDGRRVLESYERVRAFAPENKAEALDLMRQHNVSPACMSAVLEHLKDMPANEGFRLELVSNMKASSISEYNANRATKLGTGSFELTELRVVTEEVYEKDRGLERGPVNLNVHRGFTRTETESFDPRLGA